MSKLFTEAFGLALEELDDQLCLNEPNQKILRRDTRSIQTMFGNVSFKRRLVESEEGEHEYKLDKEVGLRPRIQYSDLLIKSVSQLASKGVLRSVAEAVSVLTPISMSHQTVWKITQEAGKSLDESAKADIDQLAVEEFKVIPTIFVEGDAFIIKQKGKHSSKLMVHRYQVYEGVQINGNRHSLVGRHARLVI